MDESNPLEILLQILLLPFTIIGQILSSLTGASPQRLLPPASPSSRIYNMDASSREFIASSSVTERENYQPQQRVKPSAIILPQQQPQVAYDNKEEWEIDWSSDGLPRKITVTRHATQK